MKKHWRLGLACLGVVWHVGGQQQTDSMPTQELEEVVVSDSRFPLKRAQSGKTVIRLDPEDLRHYQGQSFAQVLNELAGFEISGSRGRPGEVLGVYARGGRGRQVLVLIDGLRVTDPSSASREYDLRMLSVSDIESVEIVKGATSVLYGANAATAVISIRTRTPENTLVSLSAAGSMGTLNPAANSSGDLGQFSHEIRLGGRSRGWDYKAAFSQAYSNGLSSLADGTEEDPYSSWSADLRLGRQLSARSRLGVFASRSRMKAAYDDTFNNVDAPFWFTTTQERVGAEWTWQDSLQQIKALGAYSDFRSENQSDFPGRFDGRNWNGEVTYKRVLSPGLYGLVGLQLFQDRADLEETRDFTVVDPYLNMVWTHKSGFNLNTGFRLNMHSTYGNRGIYQVNPSYALRIKKGYLKLMGSWATAYITPSLAQLYGSFGANPGLKPEENRTLEAGLEAALDRRIRVSLLHFIREEKNTVLFDNASFAYFNSGDGISVRGLEGEFEWQWAPGSALNLNYTFAEREGGNAIRIPKHRANFSVQAPLTDRVSALLRYRYTGKRTDTDFSTFEEVKLNAFSLIDLRGDYRFGSGRLRAFVLISNVLNESFTEVLGFQTPGRNIQVGWSLELK